MLNELNMHSCRYKIEHSDGGGDHNSPPPYSPLEQLFTFTNKENIFKNYSKDDIETLVSLRILHDPKIHYFPF
jgi:hypothetical protein